MKYIVALMALAALVSAPPAKEGTWQTFTSHSGGFTVLLPGIPSFTATTDHTIVGAVVENLYSLEIPRASFSAEYSDLPGIATFFDSADDIYSHVKNGILKRTGGHLISYYGIDQAGIVGKEIVYEIPGAGDRPSRRERARFLLKGERLHVLVGSSEEAEEEIKDLVSRYLNSFQLLK